MLDLADLKAKLSPRTAAVYIENPGFLGVIEARGAEIGRLAHAAGADFIVGVDPISLGVLAAPADYGADIVVGTIQTLGAHMSAGGGAGGFIASRDVERYAREYAEYLRSGDKDQMRAWHRQDFQITVDGDGGFLVPPDMSGRIVTRLFERSELTGIITVQPTTASELEGIADTADVDAGWRGETEPVTDTGARGRYLRVGALAVAVTVNSVDVPRFSARGD
jgi:hypothetical protein